jgi:hypothetical protein
MNAIRLSRKPDQSGQFKEREFMSRWMNSLRRRVEVIIVARDLLEIGEAAGRMSAVSPVGYLIMLFAS